jgi:hypothetical protein
MILHVTEGTEHGMPEFVTKSRARTRQAIDFLVTNRRPITVKIEWEPALFDSMIVKADHGNPLLKTGADGRVFIQWLSPARGNNIIDSISPVQVRFPLGKYKLAFTAYCITKNLEPHNLGLIITYPEALVIADRRRSDRHEADRTEAPLLSKAKIKMRTGRSQEKSYDLKVVDFSENGVGMLVGKELFNWFERIGIGDRLKEVELYAPWAMVRVGGTVRHKSRIREGEYSGYQLLGIELDEKLEHYA